MKTLSFNPALLERLVCPMTKGSLAWNANNGELISASAGLAYPVRDGVPV
ncbi:MAG: Trm112 family protein, partial [Mesorhizobium sp.]